MIGDGFSHLQAGVVTVSSAAIALVFIVTFFTSRFYKGGPPAPGA